MSMSVFSVEQHFNIPSKGVVIFYCSSNLSSGLEEISKGVQFALETTILEFAKRISCHFS